MKRSKKSAWSKQSSMLKRGFKPSLHGLSCEAGRCGLLLLRPLQTQRFCRLCIFGKRFIKCRFMNLCIRIDGLLWMWLISISVPFWTSWSVVHSVSRRYPCRPLISHMMNPRHGLKRHPAWLMWCLMDLRMNAWSIFIMNFLTRSRSVCLKDAQSRTSCMLVLSL